ncbi:hypothetical protein MBLNU13_g05820t1 [Cladosporium sp. NU13]
MSLWTGIKNLFENLGASKSSYHDDETHVDRASKRKSTLRLFFSRLARISLTKHSEASKDSTHKTYDIDGHGEIQPQPSQRPTDSVIGYNGPLLSNQRPRAPSTVSTISHESIQGIVPQSLEDGIASASASTAPPSLDTLETPDAALDDDEDEPGAAETQKLLDELESAPARERRRQIIHNLLGAGPALQWMLRHPEDLWDTDEEEEARFAPMRADESVGRTSGKTVTA